MLNAKRIMKEREEEINAMHRKMHQDHHKMFQTVRAPNKDYLDDDDV